MNQSIRRIYIRLPNWIGDVCMSLPSLDAVLQTGCEVVICAKPWAKDLLSGVPAFDFIALSGKWNEDRKRVSAHRATHPTNGKSVGLLLPDSLTSALTFRLAGLPCAGYRDDGRSLLLRWPVHKPSTSLHAVESWYYLTRTALQHWGFEAQSSPSQTLHLSLTEAHKTQAQAVIDTLKGRPFVLIAPTATGLHKGRNKVWPYFDELTRHLQQQGLLVVMSPPPNEKEMALQNAPTATLLPPLGLGAFVALLQQSAAVVCNDSGVSHLAALGAPHQFTLIGVTDPQRTGPWSPNATILGKMNAWASVDEVITAVKNVL
ncbi:glycosyltransferase family 9 protein [Pelistega europaea]|uniref:Heptosyltransferase n=1 Tax=Pelistega europaea TaxID=106147 RepID=A0A7Y4L9Y2_9BURK|nr:glycosyltransferase family 9 protein [Pelistega europaea]NOL49652.1 heptosyltransferase [Pelistega europaea]